LLPGLFQSLRVGKSANSLAASIPRKGIFRILLCAPDHLHGELIMLAPLLAALHRDFPGAQVDAVVSGQGSGAMFADFPNFGRAFELPRSAWRHPLTWLKVMREVRQERYDLVLDHSLDEDAGKRAPIRCTTTRRVDIKGG
jgi:hypothetical protein